MVKCSAKLFENIRDRNAIIIGFSFLKNIREIKQAKLYKRKKTFTSNVRKLGILTEAIMRQVIKLRATVKRVVIVVVGPLVARLIVKTRI